MQRKRVKLQDVDEVVVHDPAALSIDIRPRTSRLFRRRIHDRFFIDDTKQIDKYSLSFKVNRFVFGGKRRYVVEGILALLNAGWCAIYVLETYYGSNNTWSIVSNYTFATFFLLVFLLYLYSSQNRLRFLFSLYALIDYLTIIPGFLSIQLVPQLRHLAMLRIFRVTRFTTTIAHKTYKQAGRILSIIISFLFITTSIFLIAERSTFENFHTSFYFTVLTVSTVGYGDMIPLTTLGRMLAILTIVTAIVLVPILGVHLSNILFTNVNPLSLKYVPAKRKHILIIGKNIRKASTNNFLEEIFLKYGKQIPDMRVVILQSSDPPTKGYWVKNFSKNVFFFKGDPKSHHDLHRVAAEHAQAIVIYGDSGIDGTKDYDKDIFYNNLTVKSYCPNVPTFTFLIKSESESYVLSSCLKDKTSIGDEVLEKYDGIFIIPKVELKMAIIGHSVSCKGFCTLLSNLLRSEFDEKELGKIIGYGGDREYGEGGNHEFYCGPLKAFEHLPFHQAVSKVYKELNSILIGLLIDNVVVINPYDHIIGTSELGFFIAVSKTAPESLKKFENVPESLGYEARRRPNLRSGDNKYVKKVKNEMMTRAESLVHDSSFYNIVREKLEYVSLHCHVSDTLLKDPPIIDDAHLLQNHIVIYGYVSDIVHLIRPLRSRALKKIKPILIVTKEPMPDEEWEEISIFPDIHLMIGDFSFTNDLIRANLERAFHVIISFNYPENVMSSEDQFRETAIAYLAIQKYYPSLNVIIDIEDESLLRLFHTESKLDPIFYPEIQTGKVFPRTFLDRLMAQGVWNPYIIHLIMQLAFYHTTDDSNRRHYPDVNVILRPVPRKFDNFKFYEVFKYFLKKKKSMCIGLYRITFNRAIMEREEYVYTCPKIDTVVTKDDSVYLLTSMRA